MHKVNILQWAVDRIVDKRAEPLGRSRRCASTLPAAVRAISQAGCRSAR